MTAYSFSTATMRRGPGLRHPFSFLRRMRTIARQRRELAEMDDFMLRDIGLTREEAETEANRPLWDVPRFWMK